jgi:N-methylhydantoinase B
MIDPILLEVLRCKLEAIADEGAKAVQRTAISPVVADAGDCSCAIFDAKGGLIVGDGLGSTGSNGVAAILARHGGTLAAGDIFLVNDPYDGGGFHAQDVFIHQPVFAGATLVAWVGSSAHMMDMGGSVPGSFSPAATECYQEAIRFPPVRLSRAFEEQADVWAIVRTNIRVSDLVEMDMRALISGSNVVTAELDRLIAEYSVDTFAEAVDELNLRSEEELRRRIAALEPGVYQSVSWAEWSDELYKVPCELTVFEDRLVFNFYGASPQSLHYFNSKPYVIRSLLGVEIAARIARDLPFNEGIFRAVEIRCEPGSILDAMPPAPIGAPHLEVGQTAVEVACNCLTLALAASGGTDANGALAGSNALSGLGLVTWAGQGHDGSPDAWLMLDGGANGSSAGYDRDGATLFPVLVSKEMRTEWPDVEVQESWYPLFFERRGPARRPVGAGAHRGGRSMSAAYRTTGSQPLVAVVMGHRERVPITGFAGGRPGGLTQFRIRGADGVARHAPCHSQGVALRPGETFELEVPNGGGWGDPLDRDPASVEREMRLGRISPEDAASIYGVVQGDVATTRARRSAILGARLRAAEPPRRSLGAQDIDADELKLPPLPLYPGVEQRGRIAVSARTGVPLALAPGHWTDGCPVLREQLSADEGIEVVTYLDPQSGHALAVEVVAQGEQRGFESAPLRWTQAAKAPRDRNQYGEAAVGRAPEPVAAGAT